MFVRDIILSGRDHRFDVAEASWGIFIGGWRFRGFEDLTTTSSLPESTEYQHSQNKDTVELDMKISVVSLKTVSSAIVDLKLCTTISGQKTW